jgi:prolyl 4-hydroxylase
MGSSKGSKLSPTLYFSFVTAGLILAALGLVFPDFYDSNTGRIGLSITIPKSVRKYMSNPSHEDQHHYRAQVFSRDPLVIYIHDFLTAEEIDYVLEYRYV